ncbi:MAG: penicillin-binding transpeptidase domain-containing protein [Ignavibacteriaceae bacterium]|jgi:cell division protein FtsI (penicillin-binding protein 3)|nr:penicillin-binding transpeptidase domain-containing protein [Ignavibacteriaceae bacterium]
MNNNRALFVILILLIIFSALVVRLVNIQILKSEEYSYNAQKQQTKLETIQAESGLIYDRNNVLLVYNRTDVSFYADLRMLKQKDKNDIARLFARKFNRTNNYYLNLLKGNKKTVCIEKKVQSDFAESLKQINKDGFFFREEPSRVYHYNNLASHLLGYVSNEDKYLMGISEYFKEELKGVNGSRLVQRDALGRIVTVVDESVTPAVSGNHFYLTIDKNYQQILEDELRKGVKDYSAVSGTAIIMNPNTGEILALTNVEDYNPNEYWKANDFQRRNRAITDTYEPGSTFKSFTLASLIDQNLCRLDETLDLENGKYKINNVNIRDTHPFNKLNVTGIFEQSSNIGFAKLVKRIDNEKFFKYLRGFGFGNRTSIVLPGETSGKLRKPNEWSKLSKTYLSFGYEVSVTPVQMAAAYCALINGGILYEPQLVQRQVSADGDLIKEFEPKEVRKVISDKTSEIIRNLLGSVVIKGTGKLAKSELINIGGKTGTSQKLVDGAYSKQHYNSSFIGFFPVEDPQVVCLILINSPDQGKYGGLVAAPIFKNVAERIVQTDNDKFQQYLNPNNVLKPKFVEKKSDDFEKQESKSKSKNIKKVKLSSNNKMPVLINCQIKDAINALTILGIKYKIKGSGIVISQSIAANKKLNGDEICILECAEYFVKGASLY